MKSCTQTSSPGPTPHAISARWTAAVPADKAATLLCSTSSDPSILFTKFSRSVSKAFTLGPNGTTQFVSKASLTYFFSNSASLICAKHRLILFRVLTALSSISPSESEGERKGMKYLTLPLLSTFITSLATAR